MRISGVIFFLVSMVSVYAHAWSMNDVSVLLPLPDSSQLPQLLMPSSGGHSGELLPQNILYSLNLRDGSSEIDALSEKKLKVIAIRIDPCFVEGWGPQQCQPQIRLVWQPLQESKSALANTSVFALDIAVHTFYNLTTEEWIRFLSDWKELSSSFEYASLNVHPRMKNEGYSSSYWESMKQKILDYCGAKNISRATAMTVESQGHTRIWKFHGYNIENGKMFLISIPRVEVNYQSFSLSMKNFNFKLFEEGLIEPRNLSYEFADILASSNNFMQAKDSQNLSEDLIKTSLQFENPRKNNSGTLDCVSCHLAQPIRVWNLKAFSHSPDIFKDNKFNSFLNLDNNSPRPENTNRIRGFGYFARDPVISQRAVNESALVIEHLKFTPVK